MRITAVALTLLTTGAAALTGCAMEEDTDAAQVGDLDGLGEGDDGGGKADDPNLPELRPLYGLEIVSNTRVRDTRNNGITDVQLKARASVATAQVGGDVRLFVKLCDVKLPKVGDYQPQIAVASYVASIPQIAMNGDITRSANGAYTLVTDPAALVLGAQLAAPLTEVLPDNKRDARVHDSDGDRKPGISLLIPGLVKIFGVLRVNLSLEVPLPTNATSFIGTADVEASTEILDDDSFLVNVKAMYEENEPFQEVVSTTSTVRLRANVANCADVRTTYPWQ